ncbi:MAG: Dephospho-CoA kinase [uncultured Rubrobacteraceae bacterium]|uniref:Dephospho-CoA kinase n=1 Tax=uncultured Rubrobacteraceae bacterium TaxID=349277 RepID=A0A6J4PCP5_9ACTN|nr:MAG: Dephospho-CoA kinase [uncultured Rubrobacteraceae bacterium]
MTIAVTGPFASGKSAFVGMLGDLGAHTASADRIVHDLLRWDREAIDEIGERFGEEVLGEEGVDRKALGRVVFGDPEKLTELEDILHPLVHDETDRLISFCCCEVFVVEIPLLFEAGRGEDFDHTVAVVVPEERQRAWASERGVDGATLRAIEARQLPPEEKANRADVVVENDGDLDRLKEKAEEFWARISGEKSSEGGDEEGA